MKITGTSTLQAPRDQVWKALNDPAVLVRTIPGCQKLEEVARDQYRMTVAAGVGAIKGVYDGQVRLADQQEPGSFTLHAQGAGAPGTIGAAVQVTLEDTDGGGTSLTYDADATVGGMIGGVGQRMLTGVSKKMAAEFFGNVEAVLSGAAPAAEAAAAPAGVGAEAEAGAPAAQVFTAPGAPAAAGAGGTCQPGFLLGVAVGAGVALAGAVVGGWLAGRRRG